MGNEVTFCGFCFLKEKCEVLVWIKKNKRGEDMSEIVNKMKDKIQDMFDGDNQHTNIIDTIEDQMLDKNIESKIDEELKKIDEQ